MDCKNKSDDWLPTSDDYYAVVSKEKLIFLYVDVVLTVITCALFGEECYFVIKTYKHKDISVKTIWLVSIYPVFALSALLAVIIPRAAVLCDFVSTCYLSACLFQFSSLLLLYFGHVQHLLDKVKDTGFSMRVCPCCCMVCCPVLPSTFKSLVTLRMMIFQTAVLMPMIHFIAAVLWVDGKYDRLGMDFVDAYLYLQILKIVSTITAIYGLNALHRGTMRHLKTHSTKHKQAVLQLVMLFFSLQGAVMDIPTRYNKPPPRNGLSSHFQMNQWHHLVLVVEMFLLSFLARILYRRPLELDAILENRPGNLEDIYTPDSDQADDVPMKGLPATYGAVTDQIQSVTSIKTLGIGCHEIHITVENNVDGAHGNGNVNPAFDTETADNDITMQKKAEVRNQSVPCTNDDQQSTSHTQVCDGETSATPDDLRQACKTTKDAPSETKRLISIEGNSKGNIDARL